MANPLNDEDQAAREDVRYLNEQLLKSQNLVELKRQQLKLEKDINLNNELSAQLSDKQKENATKYIASFEKLATLEKRYYREQLRGDSDAAKRTKAMMEQRKKQQEQLLKTEGGYYAAQESAYRKKLLNLTAEQQLIKDINKKRSEGTKLEQIGNKVKNLFLSKQEKQKQIDLARGAVGGGANKPPGTPGGGEKEKGSGSRAAEIGAGLAAGAKKTISYMEGAVGKVNTALTAPLADAASLLTGQSFGMGGGKVNASGATSILGSFSTLAKQIPFVGGLLGGLVDGFKAIADAVLGIDQANFRVARSLNISAKEADEMRKHYIEVSKASDSIVINDARMFQSLVEINSQLGTNLRINDEILQNDIKLRDILGLEEESRKAIAEQAMATGRDAKELTKSAIGTVGAFNKLVGTSFKWSTILSEASKLSGVLGLTFTKFPEKIYKAVAATKTLGFDLKQLDSTAGSFLDFESSISAEFEAQVLTGKEMNLTLARQAAQNNDYATLSKEIAKNVGSAAEYLEMGRIGAEATAKAVGMTRDGLADVLKKQEIYKRAGVEDERSLVKKLDLLEKQGLVQEEISGILGEQGYEIATQVSTAEALTEVMEKIKKTFVDFIKSSGLFDFLTDPARINKFITGLADKLAGATSLIGRIIASVVDLLGTVTFGETSRNFHAMAEQVRGGSEELSGNIRATTSSLGGTSPNSISDTVGKGATQQNAQSTATGGTKQEAAPVYTFHHVTQLNGQVLTDTVQTGTMTTPGRGNSIN